MASNQLISLYRQMRDDAGYVVGERAKGALQLARAYQTAHDGSDGREYRFLWDEDTDADLSWLEDGQTVDEVLGCVLERRCVACGSWEYVASVWGITDPDDGYRKVVEAELALEAGLNYPL